MSEIYVSKSSDIQDIINRLRSFNTEFRNKAGDINVEQNNLTTKWEGEASLAFQEHFRKEYPNFENFAAAIDEYVEGLTRILEEYIQAETTNTTIARE